MNPQFFYLAGVNRIGTVKVPIMDTNLLRIGISTRRGNARVKKNDGSDGEIYYVTSKLIDVTTSSLSTFISVPYDNVYSGDVKLDILQGKNDVFSVEIGGYTAGSTNLSIYNIANFGEFMSQFPDLYSYKINIYVAGEVHRQPRIAGNLLDVPNTVRRILIGNTDVLESNNALVIDFSALNVNSKLEYLYRAPQVGLQNLTRVIGNISNIPLSCKYIKITGAAHGSAIAYSGKTWPSEFDTLSIVVKLSQSENDSLLLDMARDIKSRVGDGVIFNYGWRTELSYAAVNYLQGLGFTIGVLSKTLRYSTAIFKMPFQNNFDVHSNTGMDIDSGNQMSGAGNLPSFAPGRKPGEYCAVFDGTKSIKTINNLSVNSDKVTVSMWIKTTSNGFGHIISFGNVDANPTNSFLINTRPNLEVWDRNVPGGNYNNAQIPVSQFSSWRRMVTVIDRSKPSQDQITMYIDGVKSSVTKTYNNKNNGNFTSNPLSIGSTNTNNSFFNGSIQDLAIYNYAWTESDALNDFQAQQ